MQKILLLAFGTILAGTTALSSTAVLAADEINPKELINLSLEQLSNIEVTSVSKKSEKESEAAAAIFVITQDDIHRSGMTSIPELLRMVPGLSVAQAGAHEWAISSRGATGQFANKLLVLMDGRTVYTPLFSGVYWDIQDTPLQDIERIEVIRGPGATLWGANAVNGVINIITKSAKDTQGGYASLSAGNIDNALTTVRYGAKIDDNNYARIYTKYDDRASFKTTANQDRHDAWNKAQSGFRADGSNGGDLSYTIQGDIYHSHESTPTFVPVLSAALTNFVDNRDLAEGANVLARLNHKDGDSANTTLQMYYDYVDRNTIVLEDKQNTFDIDLQRSWKPFESHEVVMGAGYRVVSDNEGTNHYFNLTPQNRTDNLFSAFGQDKIALIPESFFLTLGSKFEHNAYSGFEMQPSGRLTWLIDSTQTWWSSISHAVRSPNRGSSDENLVLQTVPLGGGNYAFYQANGRPTGSEKLNAYETGYRVQVTKQASVDISAFYDRYSNLLVNNVGSVTTVNYPGFGNYFIIPVTPVNGNVAHSHGVEIAANWDVTDYWKLTPSYSYIDFKRLYPEQLASLVVNKQPPQQASLRSVLLLPDDVEMDNSLYYVDGLKNVNVKTSLRFDTRIAWKVMDNLEVSLVGQNLLYGSHTEFTGFANERFAKVPRSGYGNITWKF